MFNTLTKQLFTGGMGLTMAKVREHYWIIRLRRLVKVIRQCCLQPHPPGLLPLDRNYDFPWKLKAFHCYMWSTFKDILR